MKKIFVLLLSTSLLLMSLGHSVFAAEIMEDEMIPLTEELAIQLANEFALSACVEYPLEATEPIVFYNTFDEPIGYIIDYYYGEEQFGYVILDSSEKSLVCEYSFDNNSLDPYQSIITTNCYYKEANNNDSKIYKIDFMTYAVYNPDTNQLYSNLGTMDSPDNYLYEYSSASSTPATTWTTIMILRSQALTDYTISGENHLIDFIAFSQTEIENNTGYFACAVSALFSCSLFYGVPFSYSNYASIWSYTGTTTTHVTGGITYGSTNYANIGSGFINFCNQHAIYVAQNSSSNPNYSFFTGMIDSNNMGVFAANIITPDGNTSGHAVSVQGYATLTNSGGASMQTLLVSDGWGYEARHLLFDSPSMFSKYGVKFS